MQSTWSFHVRTELPGVSDVAKPLYGGVKGKPHSKLKWTDEMESASVKLKSLVAEAVALRIPDHSKKFILISDCSEIGTGAVLTQKGEWCPGAGRLFPSHSDPIGTKIEHYTPFGMVFAVR